MNIEIAKKRYKEVLKVDTVRNSDEDFLATHVPFRNLLISRHYLVSGQMSEGSEKITPVTEEEAYEKLIEPSETDQFTLVVGCSGSGKSHLIRWFSEQLKNRKDDNEVALFIRRSDNTLKGTIRQLLDMPEVQNIPNREAYQRLVNAGAVVNEKELKHTIYRKYEAKLDTYADDDEERVHLSSSDKKHFIALMDTPEYRKYLMDDNGPIDRIYCKLAENSKRTINDKPAQFEVKDIIPDFKLKQDLEKKEADRRARKAVDSLLNDDSKAIKITQYLNSFNDQVIQECIGLNPGDLNQVFLDIRKELYKQGKNLTLFIEDITSFNGINSALIDALTVSHTGMYENEKICRLNAVVGCTNGYFVNNFRDNYKERVTNFVTLQDEPFSSDKKGLREFFARYLNAISLTENDIKQWESNGSREEDYPIHKVTNGPGWGTFSLASGKVNLFPFTLHAIDYFYNRLDSEFRTPRGIITSIILKYVEDSFKGMNEFPHDVYQAKDQNQDLANKILYNKKIAENERYRLLYIMSVWGNGKATIQHDTNGRKYISGLSEKVYEQLNLPVVDSLELTEETEAFSEDEDDILTPQVNIKGAPAKSAVETNKQDKTISDAMNEIDHWISDKNYQPRWTSSIATDQTIRSAIQSFSTFVMRTIHWRDMGLSENLFNILNISEADAIRLDRQGGNKKSLYYAPANAETRSVLEAFIYANKFGKKKETNNIYWDFPHGNEYLQRAENWVYKHKNEVIWNAVYYKNDNKKTKVNYAQYAIACELVRVIMNGKCTSAQTIKSIPQNLILESECDFDEDTAENNSINGHGKNWQVFQKMLNGFRNARNAMMHYYNLPQGVSTNSIDNLILDAFAFQKDYKQVINHGLIYQSEELQLNDPRKDRQIISEQLQKISEKIPEVVEEEKQKLNNSLAVIENYIDINNKEDLKEDLKKILARLQNIREKANNLKIAIETGDEYIKNLNYCKNNLNEIIQSIKCAQNIMETENPTTALVLLSRDPSVKVEKLAVVLEQGEKYLNQFVAGVNQKQDTSNTEWNEHINNIKSNQGKHLDHCESILAEEGMISDEHIS